MTFRKKATAIAMSALLGFATMGGALAQGSASGAGAGASAGSAAGTGAGGASGGQGGSAADTGGGNTNRMTGPAVNAQQPMNHPSTYSNHPSTYSRMHPWDRTYRNGMPDDTARAFGDETTVAPSAEPQGGTNDAGHSVGESIAIPPAGSASDLMHQGMSGPNSLRY